MGKKGLEIDKTLFTVAEEGEKIWRPKSVWLSMAVDMSHTIQVSIKRVRHGLVLLAKL